MELECAVRERSPEAGDCKSSSACTMPSSSSLFVASLFVSLLHRIALGILFCVGLLRLHHTSVELQAKQRAPTWTERDQHSVVEDCVFPLWLCARVRRCKPLQIGFFAFFPRAVLSHGGGKSYFYVLWSHRSWLWWV